MKLRGYHGSSEAVISGGKHGERLREKLARRLQRGREIWQAVRKKLENGSGGSKRLGKGQKQVREMGLLLLIFFTMGGAERTPGNRI